MKCFHCNKDIVWNKKEPVKEARYKMVGLDIPYINLFFHKECFSEFSDDLLDYLTKNIEKIYLMI